MTHIIQIAPMQIVAALIPRAKLVVIPRGGHMFLLERPDEPARHVVDFVAGPAERRA